MAWLNSDDKYTPWAFQVVGEIFAALPQVQWLTTLFPILWDVRGRAMHCKRVEGFSRAGFLRGEHFPRPGSLSSGWIQQESTFGAARSGKRPAAAWTRRSASPATSSSGRGSSSTPTCTG